jgi:nanoRNase/pAp phosphatase (c-di-AMP/oligoRNAs hydrolase)
MYLLLPKYDLQTCNCLLIDSDININPVVVVFHEQSNFQVAVDDRKRQSIQVNEPRYLGS